LAERADVEIVTVVTQPDRRAGRGQRLAVTPVKAAALARGLPVETPTRLRSFAGELLGRGAELAVVASYGRIVPPELLDALPLWLNVHPSLLPLYRGATPIPAAIRDGRDATAVTIIAMDAGMDTGDIVRQSGPIRIDPAMNAGELHDALAELGAALLMRTIDDLTGAEMTRVPQREWAARLGLSEAEIAASATRPFGRDDRLLGSFAAAHGARATVDFVRSLAPKPGALLAAAARLPEPLIVLRAHVEPEAGEGASAAPGEAAVIAGSLRLKPAGPGWVVLDEIVPPGRRPMAAEAYLRGRGKVPESA
jgi:methionyl-tRNA formyltransferase